MTFSINNALMQLNGHCNEGIITRAQAGPHFHDTSEIKYESLLQRLINFIEFCSYSFYFQYSMFKCNYPVQPVWACIPIPHKL